MRRLALAVLGLLGIAGGAAAHVHHVTAIEPRAFGYFVGDVIERTFEIETDRADRLLDASLPRPGALSYWLELRSVSASSHTSGNRALHKLTLEYQIFYVPLDPRKLKIPPVTLAFASGDNIHNVRLSPYTILVSPIREVFPEKSGETVETFLKPDASARYLPERRLQWIAAASGLSAVLALGGLAYRLAWWPFHRSRFKPFTRAAREISWILGEGESDAYRQALRELHRAFDAAAGKCLMARDVPEFIEGHQEHARCSGEILRFFEASRSAFFETDPAEGEKVLPRSALVDLSRRLAREERASR